MNGILYVEWFNKCEHTGVSFDRSNNTSSILSVEVNEMELKQKHQRVKTSVQSVKKQLQREFAPKSIEQLTNLNTYATLDKIERTLAKYKRVVIAAIPSSKNTSVWMLCFDALSEECNVLPFHCAPDYIDFLYALNSYFCI